MPARAARADRRRTRRARVLPSAAAALIGRRLAAARPLRSGHRGDRQGRRLDGVVSQPGLGCAMTAAYLEPEAACEIFGGPRGILAWAPGPGTARVVEDGYLVTATWSFASDSRHATGLGCHVSVVEADGTPRLNADGSPVIRTMLFPKSNARMTDIWHVIGLAARRRATTRPGARRGCSIGSAGSSSTPRGLPGWRWGSPVARSTPLSSWRATRCGSARGASCGTTT